MKILDAEQTAAALPFDRLIPALREAFVLGAEAPLRHRHDIAQPDNATASLLLMPAWTSRYLGIKLVTVFPDNVQRSLPSVFGQYVLLDGATGQPQALLDGTMLTKRRTACASAPNGRPGRSL